MQTTNIFAGRQMLLVEDDYWIAGEIASRLEAAGAEVVGPVPSVSEGLARLGETPNLFGAILDINLRGEMVFPLADELSRRKVPFIFASGYDADIVPAQHRKVGFFNKAFDTTAIVAAFLKQNSIASLVSASQDNLVLQSLDENDRNSILPLLELAHLKAGQVIEIPDHLSQDLYFIESGLVSAIIGTPPGRSIQAAIIGSEGVIGSSTIGRDRRAIYQSVVEMDTVAYRLGGGDIKSALSASRSLQRSLSQVSATLSAQVAQTLLATACYNVEKRLARLLLMINDRVPGDRVGLTHDRLARMLCVRRPGITTALHVMEGNRLIYSRRGAIVIRDRDGLVSFTDGAYLPQKPVR